MRLPATLLTCSLLLLACNKSDTPTTDPATATPAATDTPAAATDDEPEPDPLAGKPVVPNVDAKPGDVTTCPYSGRTFLVKEDHPHVEYEGKSYVICSEKAAAEVEADPGKYLDDFTG